MKELSEGDEIRRETARSSVGSGGSGVGLRRSVGGGVFRDMARSIVGGGVGVRFRISPVGSESLNRFPARFPPQLHSNPQLSLLRR
jgi:hypothetical protein